MGVIYEGCVPKMKSEMNISGQKIEEIEDSRLQDGERRLFAARRCLDHQDIAGAIREIQLAVELTFKSMLNLFGVDYPKNVKGHDVSNMVGELYAKIEGLRKKGKVQIPFFYEKHQRDYLKSILGKGAVLLKLLNSVRLDATYSVENLGIGAGTIFAVHFQELTKCLYNLAWQLHREYHDLLSRMKKILD